MNYIYSEIKEKYSNLKIQDAKKLAENFFLNRNIKYYRLKGRGTHEFNHFTNPFENEVIGIFIDKIIKVEVYEDHEDAILTKLTISNGNVIDYDEWNDFEIIDNTIIHTDDEYLEIIPTPQKPQDTIYNKFLKNYKVDNDIKIIEIDDKGEEMLNTAYHNLLKARGEIW